MEDIDNQASSSMSHHVSWTSPLLYLGDFYWTWALLLHKHFSVPLPPLAFEMDKVYYSYMADPVTQSSITLASASKNLEAAVDGLNQIEGESTPTSTQPRWSRIRHAFRYAFSEFFGTMIMMLFGDGVVAQVLLSGKQKGEYQSITWGWG